MHMAKTTHTTKVKIGPNFQNSLHKNYSTKNTHNSQIAHKQIQTRITNKSLQKIIRHRLKKDTHTQNQKSWRKHTKQEFCKPFGYTQTCRTVKPAKQAWSTRNRNCNTGWIMMTSVTVGETPTEIQLTKTALEVIK